MGMLNLRTRHLSGLGELADWCERYAPPDISIIEKYSDKYVLLSLLKTISHVRSYVLLAENARWEDARILCRAILETTVHCAWINRDDEDRDARYVAASIRSNEKQKIRFERILAWNGKINGPLTDVLLEAKRICKELKKRLERDKEYLRSEFGKDENFGTTLDEVKFEKKIRDLKWDEGLIEAYQFGSDEVHSTHAGLSSHLRRGEARRVLDFFAACSVHHSAIEMTMIAINEYPLIRTSSIEDLIEQQRSVLGLLTQAAAASE